MTTNKALEILGLYTGATIKKVLCAYRRLSKIYHPDINGSHEGMVQLLEAKNRAIKYVTKCRELPYDMVTYYRGGEMCGSGYIIHGLRIGRMK
jgi:hypothetical protein